MQINEAKDSPKTHIQKRRKNKSNFITIGNADENKYKNNTAAISSFVRI
jgi:hypothetical protein